MRSRFLALFCAALLLFTGCVSEPKDDFADYEFVEPLPVEGVTAQTEFAEYGGNVEDLCIIVTNDSDEDFHCDPREFYLNKKVGDQWKPIKVGGFYNSIVMDTCVSPHSAEKIYLIEIEDHTKLPLLSGHYRIWVGKWNGDMVPAEFDVK